MQPSNYTGVARSNITVTTKGGAININKRIVTNACSLCENLTRNWSKVQYWQLIDIPRPISSYCFL